MKATVLAGLLLFLFGSRQAAAQVSARQATPPEATGEESVEIPDPMLLDVPLTGGAGKSLADPSVNGRTLYGTKKFVCDKARVPKITVLKKPRRDGGLDLEVTPTVTSEWPRQDIDLKVAIVMDGKELQNKTWDDLTVGADDSAANKMGAMWASSTKILTAVFRFKKGEFESLFEGSGPTLRIIVDIQE
jgi:hypothetical protein